MIGIVSASGYIPRHRLDRKLIFDATGWMTPSNAGLSRGTKSVASFDEDSVTMSVAAGLSATREIDRSRLGAIYFASTCMPFKERSNAGIIKTALDLNDAVSTADYSSGIKAGTTALLAAIDGVASGRTGMSLVCSADSRLGKPTSPQEMIFGDAAASLVVGDEGVVAEYRGSYCTAHDFVDHYRGAYAKFDRQWEDRWIRDEGLMQLIPEAIAGFLEKYQMAIGDFTTIVYPCHYAAARKQLNRKLNITAKMEQGNLQAEIGETGTPHALLMLVHALESASPGDNIMVVCFGSGCDVLHFTVTDEIKSLQRDTTVGKALANGVPLDNYIKYLVWRDILPAEKGLRSEEDLWTRWSATWRKRREILGLVGSQCVKCGTAHYPPQRICVNPECGAINEMESRGFSDKVGRIASYTGDNLAASLNPPAIYGQIEFEDGGKYLFDLTDCDLDGLETNMPVNMSFRRRYHDPIRDISGYFWKAVPIKEEN